jgi:hypothetical protein
MISRKLQLSLIFIITSTIGFSQSFNVQQVTKSKLVNVTGGASANAVAYSGNNAREPFTYFLNGNINVNVLGLYNLPFSFSYSSQKFGYNKPVLSNRLSIHPSYKWVTGHIGDASMSFSPYTLSGHQFTGFGVDLTPQGKFKISAMYGRLVKDSEFDPINPTLVPTYKRFGYGFKTAYALEKINLGLSVFKAKDEINSLSTPVPFELGLSPKENAAISFDATFSLFKKLQIATEYANSSVTEDTRVINNAKAKGIASLLLSSNSTTASYNAFKVNLIYPAGKGTIGLGYERVDPNYRTLGGYFFNNDLENITVNASQSLYKDKVSVATNFGLQKDNLDQQKESQMRRLVSSATVDVKATKKLNVNLTYSNFQSFTNSRNQFDYINQTNQFQKLDTLNYRQVNQNAGIAINYLLKDSKESKHSINANFDMQDAVNQQGGTTTQGGATTSYNSAVSYTLGFPEKNRNISASVNNSVNKTDMGTSFIFGPTAGVTQLFFDKKLNTSFSSSYNASYANGVKRNDVINFRLNGSYIYLEKHNFNLGVTSLFSKSGETKVNDITANLTYSYSFDKIKVRFKKPVAKPEENLAEEGVLKINVGSIKLEGKRDQIIKQLQEIQLALQPLPAEKTAELEELLKLAGLTPDEKQFRTKVFDYLEAYQKNGEIVNKYNQLLLATAKKLEQELLTKTDGIENAYLVAVGKVNNHKLHNKNPSEVTDKVGYNSYLKLVERANKAEEKLVTHKWMLQEFATIAKTPIKELSQNQNTTDFGKQAIEKMYKTLSSKKPDAEISMELEQEIIPFFHQLAIKKGVAP